MAWPVKLQKTVEAPTRAGNTASLGRRMREARAVAAAVAEPSPHFA